MDWVTIDSMHLLKADLQRAIREAVGKHLDLKTHDLFIFGSEAAGNSTPQSDIDIGIRGPQFVPKATIQRIRDELETVRTLRVFDVVDLAVADPTFVRDALQTAEKI